MSERYIVAGFGDSIDPKQFRLFEGAHLHGVRRDVTEDNAHAFAVEFDYTTLKPLYIVNGGSMTLDLDATVRAAAEVARWTASDKPFAVEAGNEPDISPTWRRSPLAWAAMVNTVAQAVWAIRPDAVIVSGGISDLSTAPLDYLTVALQVLDPRIVIGYHNYDTTHAWRPTDLTRLRQLTVGRRLWHTEGGWHNAPSVLKVFGIPYRTIQFTPDQCADFMQHEIAYQALLADVVTVFSAHDGPDNTQYEQAFGAWDWNWNEKPLARMLQGLSL